MTDWDRREYDRGYRAGTTRTARQRPSVEPLLLRMDEVATKLNISRSHAYELVSRGEMPGVIRVGQSIRVSVKALDAWIDKGVLEGGTHAAE